MSRTSSRGLRRHVARDAISFTHVDIANARYNRNGSPSERSREQLRDDAIYGYWVLSHMDASEVADYLAEIRRLLET